MTAERCETCGKQQLGAHAGSVTSYFFQHNYCQCNVAATVYKVARPPQSSSLSQICRSCGKGRSSENRAGSFTSFLFKELRCRCLNPIFDGDNVGTPANPDGRNSGREAGRAANSSGAPSSSGRRTPARTKTAARFEQRKQARTQAESESELDVLAPGTIIGSIFQIISMIGMGGMGVVYLAKHKGLNSQFALKVLAPDMVNEQTWQRFKGEAKTLAALNHPTLVKVYDLGIHDNTLPFYSMDFLSGRNLEEILMEDGPMPLDKALSIFIEVLDGLAYAHRNGVVHRDIKPANIMLCTIRDTRAVKILDFGISKLAGDISQEQNLTMAGDVFGSPYYMSPEQCAGRTVDARSDIYSTGCALFEVLTGYVPFEGDSSVDTMIMHEEKDVPLLKELAPQLKLPESLDMVLARCMAKAPRDRYQSAKEVALDLNRILEGKDIAQYSPAVFNRQKQQKHDSSIDTGEASGTAFTAVKASNKLIMAAAAGLLLLLSVAIFMINSNFKLESNRIDSSQIARATALAEKERSRDDTQNSATRRYSSIIDNGNTISFHFPDSHAIGKISPFQEPDKVQEAIGVVNFPVGTKLKFQPSSEAWTNPKILEPFGAYDLYEISVPYSATELTDLRDGLVNIAKLEGLGSLNFKATVLGDDQISLLNKLPHLEILNIEMTAVTGNGIANLKRLRQLKHLNFSYNKGVPAMLAAITGSTALVTLDIDACEQTITAQEAKQIAACPNLRFVNLKNDTFASDALLPLGKMKKLQVLNVAHSDMDSASRERLKQAMDKIGASFVWTTLKTADMTTTEGMIKNADMLPILPYEKSPGEK